MTSQVLGAGKGREGEKNKKYGSLVPVWSAASLTPSHLYVGPTGLRFVHTRCAVLHWLQGAYGRTSTDAGWMMSTAEPGGLPVSGQERDRSRWRWRPQSRDRSGDCQEAQETIEVALAESEGPEESKRGSDTRMPLSRPQDRPTFL